MDARPADAVTSTMRTLAQGIAHLLRLRGRPFDKYPSGFQEPAAAPASRQGI